MHAIELEKHHELIDEEQETLRSSVFGSLVAGVGVSTKKRWMK